jgi:hypothetical protein
MTLEESTTSEQAAEFETAGLWLLTRSWFVLAGLVATAAVLTIRSLSVPLAETTYAPAFPYLSFPISFAPTWVEPVTLRLPALQGLKPSYLVTTIGLWVVATVAVTVAAGLLWWAFGRESGVLPPFSRLGWLTAYGVAAVVSTSLAVELVAGLIPPAWTAMEWGGGLGLALVAGRLFVAPVTIVLDGRRPLSAIRFSVRSLGGVRWTLAATGLVLALAFARHLVTAPFGAFGGGRLGLSLTIVVGTAIVGSAHAFAMYFVYDRIAMH